MVEKYQIPNRMSWETAYFRLTKKLQGTVTDRPKRFENEVFLITEPGGSEPNFLYKPTGFAIHYPVYAFKLGTWINKPLTTREFITIISKCVQSLKAPKKPRKTKGK